MKKQYFVVGFLSLVLMFACLGLYLSINFPLVKQNEEVQGDIISYVFKARQSNVSFNYKKALGFYDKALEIEPENESLMEEYLMFVVSQRNFDKAFAMAQKIIIKVPNHFLANLVLTAKNIRENKITEAISHLQSLGHEDYSLNDIVLRILIGMKSYEAENIEQFVALNKPIEEVLPEFYHYLYASVALYNKDEKSAKDQFEFLNANYPNVDGVIYYSQMLYNEDKDIGITYFREYLNDNFISQNSAKNFVNSYPKLTIQKIVSDSLVQISKLMSPEVNSNFLTSDSVAMINVALMIDPQNYSAQIALAYFYESIGDYKSAINIYDSIPKNIFHSRLVNTRSAEILLELGEGKLALKSIQKIIKDEPNNPMLFIEQGQIFYKLKEYKKAIASYKQALYLGKKENSLLSTWLSHYFMGIAYDKMGNWEQAEKNLIIAKNLDDSDPILINYLAYSWIIRDKNIDQSLQMLKDALHNDPENAAILDSYAWAYFKLKDYEVALDYSQKANEINPYDPVLNNHLADILWQIGDTTGAMAHWKIALNLTPEDELRQEIENKVNGKLPPYLDSSFSYKKTKAESFIEQAKR
jgi:tetratricopeptide (TPR) repeat protein